MTIKKGKNPFRSYDRTSWYLTGKFVGAYIPDELAVRLRLASCCENVSVQSYIQKRLEEFLEEKDSAESMIQQLADKAHLEWRQRYSEDVPTSKWVAFRSFTREITRYLQKRHIPDFVIQQILEELKEKI